MKIRTEFSEEEILKYPELSNPDNIFCLTYILNRVNDGKNALGLTFGGTGSGKSWVDLRIAELLCVMQGRTFDTSSRVIFGLNSFLDYTNKKDLPPGDVSIPEELGVNMGSRKWQKNIDYSELLQTFRNLQTICLFNAPFKVMIDKHARLLAHFQIEMLGREGIMNVTKFFILQHNPAAQTESKTTYKKYLRIPKENQWGFRSKTPIKKVFWYKPSEEVLSVYIPMQDKFKEMVRKNMRKKSKDEEETVKPTKIGKVQDEEVQRLNEKGLIADEIAGLLHVHKATIYRSLARIKNIQKNHNI